MSSESQNGTQGPAKLRRLRRGGVRRLSKMALMPMLKGRNTLLQTMTSTAIFIQQYADEGIGVVSINGLSDEWAGPSADAGVGGDSNYGLSGEGANPCADVGVGVNYFNGLSGEWTDPCADMGGRGDFVNGLIGEGDEPCADVGLSGEWADPLNGHIVCTWYAACDTFHHQVIKLLFSACGAGNERFFSTSRDGGGMRYFYGA
ncbi:hypothetical protein SESBI_06664 [Sesbania bispinosa]|nr:hypothetical protein SESBI_06664 [Sesbania bispinosa]